MGAGYDSWQMFAPDDDTGPGALDAATRRRLLAQAAALRGQEQLGTVASFTGDKVLAPYGQQLVANARQGAEQLGEMPGQRLRMALQRQQLATGQAEEDAKAAARQLKTNPASAESQTARALLAKFMPQMKVSPTATAQELEPVLGLGEKGYQVDENARNRALQRQAMQNQQNALLGTMGDDTLNALADKFAAGGGLPQLGLGKAGAGVRVAIMQRASERHPGLDLASAEAGYKADTGSLKALQAQADRVDAFEKTANANLDTALGAAKKVIDTGSPWFNRPLRAVQQGLAGSADLQRYITARQVAVQEVAKVLSGGTGSGVVSDSARGEVEQLLGPDASLAQIEAAAQVLKQDMANRKAAMQGQLGAIRSRTSGSKASAAAPEGSAAAPSSSPGVVEERTLPDGRVLQKLSDGTVRVKS
jgi:hypothetical protein